MSVRHANARWEGTLKQGSGTMNAESGAFSELPFTRASRFADGDGTNPEELIGAAHAGCFSMFLSGLLSSNDYEPDSIDTTADVTIEVLDDGPAITSIALQTKAAVPGLDDDEFQSLLKEAKDGCPVSKALAGVDTVSVNGTLKG